MKKRTNQSGFTLLEIMLVVTIIALLLGAAIYKLGGNVELAIDVSIVRGGDRRTVRLQRFNLELGDLLHDQPTGVNGEIARA